MPAIFTAKYHLTRANTLRKVAELAPAKRDPAKREKLLQLANLHEKLAQPPIEQRDEQPDETPPPDAACF
jgi:hypothetical protein